MRTIAVSLTMLAKDFFAEFLAQAGVEAVFHLRVLRDGRVCRLYRVADRQRTFVLKWYGKDPASALRRLKTERAFYTLAWERGLRQIPEPIAWDEERLAGLFVHVPGRAVRPADINLSLIVQTVAFLVAINRARPQAAGRGLPPAAGASFSLERHLAGISRLVGSLARIKWSGKEPERAREFITEELEPAWQMINELALRRCQDARISPTEILPLEARCLSPFDMGLQHALIQPDGTLMFMDFDSAGWDDPARLIANFFSHGCPPVPLDWWPAFANNLARALGAGDAALARSRILLPTCCLQQMCLNLQQMAEAKTTSAKSLGAIRRSLREIPQMMEMAVREKASPAEGSI